MSFPFSKLSPEAAVSAAEQMIDNMKHLEAEPAEERIFELVTNIQTETPKVTEAIGKKREGEYTEEIGEADDFFHNNFEVFRDSAENASRRGKKIARGRVISETNESIAGGKIAARIAKYGRYLHQLPRQEQVGKFDALIIEFDTPEVQAELTTANILPDYTAACDSHKYLKSVLIKSTDLESKKSQIACAGKAGRVLTRSLSDLYNVVGSLARIGNTTYGDILIHMDETLDKFRPMLNHKPKKDEEESTSPDIEEGDVQTGE